MQAQGVLDSFAVGLRASWQNTLPEPQIAPFWSAWTVNNETKGEFTKGSCPFLREL